MMEPIYHLFVGICANRYPISHIPTNKWYMVSGHTIALYSTGKCNGVTKYHLSVGICAIDIQKYLAESNKNKTWKEKKLIHFYYS